MKKLIFITIAFISVQAFAQDRERGGKKDRADMIENLSAEEIAALATKKMTLGLDLSEAQQTKVQTILLEEATFRKEKMKARQALKADVEALKPSKEERLNMQNEKLDREIEMKQQMKSILSDEQYVKWESNLMERKANRNDKPKGKRKK